MGFHVGLDGSQRVALMKKYRKQSVRTVFRDPERAELISQDCNAAGMFMVLMFDDGRKVSIPYDLIRAVEFIPAESPDIKL